MPFIGIRSWATLIAFYVVIGIGTIQSWRVSRTGRTHLGLTLVTMMGAMVMFTRVAGPFILTPIVGCGILISMSGIPELTERPRLVIALAAVAVIGPLVLEWTGILPHTFDVTAGAVVSTSDIFVMRGRLLDTGALIFVNLFFILVAGGVAFALSGRRRRAQRAPISANGTCASCCLPARRGRGGHKR